VRGIDAAVARDRCAGGLGLPGAEVDKWKPEPPADQPRPRPAARLQAAALHRVRRMRDFLTVFRRHSIPREPAS
jgi:hypothetical protein